MLPSVDSPHTNSSFCRKGSSTSCNAVGVVVKEIRSSLFLATSIIEDDASDAYVPVFDSHGCKSKINFECGRLKYSHVKGEWSILHRPIRMCEDSVKKSSKRKNPVAMVIASLLPVPIHQRGVAHNENKTKSSRCSRNDESSKKIKKLQYSISRRELLSNETDRVGDVGDNFDSIPIDDADCIPVQSATTASMLPSSTSITYLDGQPIPPPIELVRCLLNGAEFISMMNCARRDVESSIRKKKDGVDASNQRGTKMKGKTHDGKTPIYSKARFWSRRLTKNLKQRSINLQPMIVALTGSTIGTNSPLSKPSPLSSLNTDKRNDCYFDKSSLEKNMIKVIDECIRFAHIHTMDLISPWSPYWQVGANLRSEKIEYTVEDENRSSSTAGSRSSTTCRFMSELLEKGNKRSRGNRKSNIESVSFEAVTTIYEFVMACLTKPREDIVRSNTVMSGSTKNSSSRSKDLNVDHYARALYEAPKRNTSSQRSKIFTREPGDSLVATCMKRNQNTVSSATKQPSALLEKESLLEKQRLKRMRSNRHISPSSSVLENTTTVTLQGKGGRTRATRSDSGSKRKWSDSSSPQITRSERNTIEKIGIGKDQNVHSIGFLNKREAGLDKEKISPNSLYNFFEKKRKHNRKKVTGEMLYVDDKDMKIADNIIHVQSQQHEEKGWDHTPSPGTISQLDAMPTNSLVLFESTMGNGNIVSAGRGNGNQEYRHENGRQQSELIDSLHGLARSSQSVPASHRSSDSISLGNESSYCSTNRSSSGENAVKDECIGSRVQRRKPIKPEWKLDASNGKRSCQPIRVEERLESSQNSFHPESIEVEKEAIDFIVPRDKVVPQDNEVEGPHAKRYHSKDELGSRSRDCSINPDRGSTSSNMNKDLCSRERDYRALETAPSLPWINLSHIGHISDYHGYKRKYEHFAPLQFGDVAYVRRQIERTLTENGRRSDEESDEEVTRDSKDYERAIDKYEILAEKEREMEKKCEVGTPQNSKKETLGDMLVIFSKPEGDDNFASPKADSLAERCNMTALGIDESPSSYAPTNFRFIDDDEDYVLSSINEDKGGNKLKRRSRSSQIAHQKKTSIRILNEILHTLDFIQKYNGRSRGALQETRVEMKREDVKGGDEDVCSNVRNSDSKRHSRKERGGRDNSSASNKLEIAARPAFPTLDTASLLKAYHALRDRFSLFYPLNRKDDIRTLKEEIQTILDKDDYLLHNFFGNSEIITEEKALARCIRGYSSKADQEKIEKRDFEEKQKLRQHEFEYYCRLKKKKKSPQEIELKEMTSRPINYVRGIASLLTKTDGCNLKPNCKICRPILEDECCDRNIIFSPKFRRAEINPHITSDVEPDGDSVWNISSNPVAPLKQQKLVSLLNLSELYHTLDFINNYNDGLIVSRKGRK